ncbi:unnamed protein product [Tuber aestivum]|uniref:Uncharacterized protein n=1 Tax=Tuber aestivum TaxID=59557 RepID=A0A292Q5X9_9PEZI|nr:unnamed protein product [Tuber aestivum]
MTTPDSMAPPRTRLELVDIAVTKAVVALTIFTNYDFAFGIESVPIYGWELNSEAVETPRILSGKEEKGTEVPGKLCSNPSPGFGVLLAGAIGRCKDGESGMCGSRQTTASPHVTPTVHLRSHPNARSGGGSMVVLVTGGAGKTCCKVPEGYGFEDVMTLGDLIVPFSRLIEKARQLPVIAVDAIFVFAEGRIGVAMHRSLFIY